MIQAQLLSELPGVRHAFFTREGGVSDGIYASLNGGVGSKDEAARIAENRSRMARALDVEPSQFLTAYQVHSADAVVAEKPWDVQTRPRADAIATRTPGLAIGVTTADCGPLLFADPDARVIGAAHAGWRGALAGVIDSTIAAMESLGARRSGIVAVLGPTIGQSNYEVGSELREAFLQDDGENACFFAAAARSGHYRFDLPGYIEARLRRAGIARSAILGLCTYGDPERFYSYRRSQHRSEADYGRHVNAIVLTR